MIKVIETEYNGYRFRSRLEARWAVFFDALGIKYQYEPEGFDADGVKYLPDFYLPDADRWIEIKGKKLSVDEIRKCEAFCEEQDKDGVLFTIFIGQPLENFMMLKPGEDGKPELTANPKEAVFVGIQGFSYRWKSAEWVLPDGSRAHDSGNLFVCHSDLCEQEVLSRFSPALWNCTWDRNDEKLIRSAVLARKARFEHGETPWRYGEIEVANEEIKTS